MRDPPHYVSTHQVLALVYPAHAARAGVYVIGAGVHIYYIFDLRSCLHSETTFEMQCNVEYILPYYKYSRRQKKMMDVPSV